MKKWLFTFMLMLGIVIPGMTNATIRWISESQWKSYDSSYWFSQTCDENVENEIYLWHGWVFLDYFSNPKSNNAPFYIHNYKVMTRGNYVLYNDSIFSPKNEKSMIIFNRDLLASKWWKVKPWEEVRHMTTAEEVNGATFSYNWVMDNPFTASDWKVFSIANFRSDWSHPANPTKFPSWDAEFRIVTLYDADDNLSTTSDNRAIVECQQNVIRRCGDGILDTKHGETCDPKAEPWVSNNSCDPVTCKESAPKCASKYNWQTVTNLVEGPYLCEVWTVSEFNYDENTHTWTWKCKNTAGNSVNCSAKKPYDWTLKIEKTLTTAKQIKEVGETVKWEIVVKAVSGDVKDFTITDTLPDVLDYVDYAIKYNPSNLTVMAPTRDWKKVTWQVTWTLKSWQTLKIELITKANKMPTQEEKNVACVKWTNPVDPNNPDYPNDDCDDDSIEWTKWKLKIEKTLTTAKQIKEVGEEVKWNIKVFAVSGDVTNFTLTDSLPDVLDYVSYKVVSNPANLTLSQPTVNGKNIAWKVTWTLKSWQVLELELVSKANTMPTKEEKNVACVKWENTDPVDPNNPDYPNDDCDDDSIEPKLTPKVWIKKTFDDGSKKKTVKVWEKMTYRITFGNSWNADATITSIKDFLPKNVQYISWSIYLNSNSSHEQFTWGETIDILRWVVSTVEVIDGVHVEKYGGITLKPGDTGYILIEVKVLERKENDSTTNFACIYVNDEKVDCDDAVHDITDSELLCKSNIKDKDSADLCYGSSWTVPVTCESEWGTGDTIAILCDGKEAFTGKNISQLTGSCVFSADGDHTVQCKVNGSTKAASGSNCEWVYNLKHHSCGGGGSPSCSSITTSWATTNLTKWNNKVEVTCNTKGGSAYVLIDCDYKSWKDYSKTGNFMISTGRVTTFSWVCENYEKDSKIQCLVKEYESSSWQSPVTACAKDVTIKPSTSWCFPEWTKVTMADGTLKNIEEVQEWDVVLSYNTATNTNEKNVVKRQIVHTNHEHEMYELTVNGEILKVTDVHPFYVRKSTFSNDYSWVEAKDLKVWNILLMTDGSLVKIENITHYANVETVYNLEVEGNHNYFVDKWYLVHNKWWGGWGRIDPILLTWSCFNVNGWNASIESWEYLPFYLNVEKLAGHKNNNDSIYVWTGNVKEWAKCSSWWQLALNSMECYYEIMKWNKKPIATWSISCLTGWDTDKKMVEAWINWQSTEYKDNMDSHEPWSWTNYTFKSNVEAIKDFWENVTEYGEYKISLTKIDYMFCNENKQWEKDTWSWVCQSNVTLTKPYTVQKTPSGNLSNTTTDLSKFTTLAGDSFATKYLPAISTSVYQANNKVKNAMTAFINKYEKLAVKVNNTSQKFWYKAIVKKVPWKNIYFLSGDAEFNSSVSNNTFTIVQTNGDVTIKGDFNHNVMILTKWNITFSWDCTTTQKVKWIFYAWWKLIRSWVEKNTELSHDYWCDEWWLQVRWVLIWKNFNNLMNNSRSSLNSWFNEGTNKRKAVMDWASVLIEYSPSIFTKSTMPPGAEDFTTALSVYKN